MLSKLLRYLTLALIGIIAFASVRGMQSAKPEKITLEDLLAVEPVGAPVLLPDGTQLAMIRNEQVVLMPSDGGWPVRNATRRRGRRGDPAKGRQGDAGTW